MRYPLAERFVSINGEGQRAGQLAVFLRFRGCNLDCSYCDTAWACASDCPAEELSAAEISDYVKQSGVSLVTVTGGEPLSCAGMPELLRELSALPGVLVEVETNGSVPLASFVEAVPSLSITMDYKLPTSGMEGQMHLPNLEVLRPWDTLKFVCGSRKDMLRGREILAQYPGLMQVPTFFSPVFGGILPAEMVSFLQEFKLTNVRLQLQLHKMIWPAEQRGV